MILTFLTELGQSFVVEIDPDMELENVMALVEAESGIPVAEQSIHFESRDLSDVKATMRQHGVGNDSILELRRKVQIGDRTLEHDSEMMRLQLLGNPETFRQCQQYQPELAAAAQSDPARFGVLLRQMHQRQVEAEQARQREILALEADPYNVEAQRQIEEYIRQEAVFENLEHALEYSPESFGRVTMLYIDAEINGNPIKAFVDSGAQQTIISPTCAEACGIMRLIDRRYSGMALGVGAAPILGKVHSAQMKIGDLYLACSFTVMESRDVDLLFGLDMLKRHQACIDLEKNCLRIQGREIRFLAEHELPERVRQIDAGEHEEPRFGSGASASEEGSGSSFPGAGQALGAPPSGGAPSRGGATPQPSRYSEETISTLMGLGATREIAIQALDAAGGNVDVAASLLF